MFFSSHKRRVHGGHELLIADILEGDGIGSAAGDTSAAALAHAGGHR